MTSGPPSAVILGTHSRAKSPDTARNTTSHSRAASSVNSSINFSPNGVAIGLPAERADAKSLSSSTGKLRLPRTSMISSPTAPVTPTTPTLSGFDAIIVACGCRTVAAAVTGMRAAGTNAAWRRAARVVAAGAAAPPTAKPYTATGAARSASVSVERAIADLCVRPGGSAQSSQPSKQVATLTQPLLQGAAGGLQRS